MTNISILDVASQFPKPITSNNLEEESEFIDDGLLSRAKRFFGSLIGSIIGSLGGSTLFGLFGQSKVDEVCQMAENNQNELGSLMQYTAKNSEHIRTNMKNIDAIKDSLEKFYTALNGVNIAAQLDAAGLYARHIVSAVKSKLDLYVRVIDKVSDQKLAFGLISSDGQSKH